MKRKPIIQFKEKVTVVNEMPQVSSNSANQVLNSSEPYLWVNPTETVMCYKPIEIKYYKIDFNKVKTINDVVSILKEMDLQVSGNAVNFKNIKHLLKEK